MDANLPHCEYQTLKVLPSADSRDMAWLRSLELRCSVAEITHDEAKAHVLITQRMACVVREGARGPKGGRGKMHYNRTPEWPGGWMENIFNRYFIVLDQVEAKTYPPDADKAARLALGYGMGKDAFQQVLLDSIKNGLGMVMLSDPKADEPVVNRFIPRSKWWQR